MRKSSKKRLSVNKFDIVIGVLTVVIFVMVINVLVLNIKTQEELDKQEVLQYKLCIIEQSEERGWIIRSECADNYAELDRKAGLEYTQSGYDLYLK